MWHSIWSWLGRGDWRPSFDGIAAIVAGVIGFVAIIRQTRSSELSVRRQLEAAKANLDNQLAAEKAARNEESTQEMRSVATGFLHEIDIFYLTHLMNREKALDYRHGISAVTTGYNLSIEPMYPFVIYATSAGKLGIFEPALVKSLVLFYTQASVYFDLRRRHTQAQEHTLAGRNSEVELKVAGALEPEIRSLADSLVTLGQWSCVLLARASGTDYPSLYIAKEPSKPVADGGPACSETPSEGEPDTHA